MQEEKDPIELSKAIDEIERQWDYDGKVILENVVKNLSIRKTKLLLFM